MAGRNDSESPRRRKKPGKRSLLRRLIILFLILLFLMLAAAAGLFGIFYYYGNDPTLPSLNGLGDYHPDQIIRVLDREGKVIGEIGATHRIVVPYTKIPKVMVHALLAAEDAEYFEHEGIAMCLLPSVNQS